MIYLRAGSDVTGMMLEKLMGPEFEAGLLDLRILQHPSSLYASAKTLLIVRNLPVALILDANSTEPFMADRARDEAAEVVGEPAAGRLVIFVAVPSVEALLFRRPEAVERVFGPLTPHLIEVGRISPGDAWPRFAGAVDRAEAAARVVSQLDDEDIQALRAERPVRDVLDFVAEVARGQALTVAT